MDRLAALRKSRAWWRGVRRRATQRRQQARHKIAQRNRQIEALSAGRAPTQAVKFLSDRVGAHEDAGRPNRAEWLDRWAREIGQWMVGQPWCGLAVWKAAKAGGKTLSKETMSTVAIRRMAIAGDGGFKAWHPASATPQLGWVAIYGTGSPQHTGMYGGGDSVYEGNTSPGAGGSQNNGGGLYRRSLASRRAWLLGWAEIAW